MCKSTLIEFITSFQWYINTCLKHTIHVHVHVPVCPYANIQALYPSNAFSNISFPRASNTFS